MNLLSSMKKKADSIIDHLVSRLPERFSDQCYGRERYRGVSADTSSTFRRLSDPPMDAFRVDTGAPSSYPGYYARAVRINRACPAGVTSLGEEHDSRATRLLTFQFPLLNLLAFMLNYSLIGVKHPTKELQYYMNDNNPLSAAIEQYLFNFDRNSHSKWVNAIFVLNIAIGGMEEPNATSAQIRKYQNIRKTAEETLRRLSEEAMVGFGPEEVDNLTRRVRTGERE